MRKRIKWILTRPRVLVRASRALGWQTMLRLVRIRLTGSERSKYVLHIPGYIHPIFIRGGKSSDALALYEILVSRGWALTATVDSPAFIIDGGANCGIASVYFLNRYPGSRVVAIEPAPETLEVCRKNLEPYGERATLIHGAIWKSKGWLHLEKGAFDWNNRVRDDQSGSVEAFTMPSLIALGDGKVDVLKLDIEGSEAGVFGPDAQEWLPNIRNIAIELHGDECKARFLEALTGYQCDMSLRRSWSEAVAGSSVSCYLAICQNLRPPATATTGQASD